MRSRFVFSVIVILVLCTQALAYNWSTNPGNGSPENPYQISSPEHLISIGSDPVLLTKHYILTNNIVFDPDNNPAHVFTGALIAPGPAGAGNPVFSGHFDGNEYHIVNLKILSAAGNIGLFGNFLGSNAEQVFAEDITFVNPVISGPQIAGALVGRAELCTIRNCRVIGGQVNYSGGNVMGGLMGTGNNNIIENCSSSAEVSGASWVGGLSGSNNSTAFINCSATGNVAGTGSYVGGLVGDFKKWRIPALNEREEMINCHAAGNVYCGTRYGGGLVGLVNTGLIENCSASGTVTGQDYLGGLIGYVKEQTYNQTPPMSGPTTIKGCCAAGDVAGQVNYIGGLIGWSNAVLIKDCYARGNVSSVSGGSVGGFAGRCNNSLVRCYSTGSVSGAANTGGFAGFCDSGNIFLCYWDTETSGTSVSNGGLRKTTAQMQTMATYRGWGDDIWLLDEGNDYPRLAWEGTIGKSIEDQRSYAGNGTSNNPFRVATVDDLVALGLYVQDWDKHIILTDDIVLDPTNMTDPNVVYDNANFNKIGFYSLPFSGRFNGGFYRISNLRNQSVDENENGLFGKLQGDGAEDVVVENVKISDARFSGMSSHGGLAGGFQDCKVVRCGIENTILSVSMSQATGGMYFGGLAGYARNSTISQCYVNNGRINFYESNVTNSMFMYGGGLIGNVIDTHVENSYAICTFHLNSSHWIGGLIGQSQASSFYYCYTVPTLTSTLYSIPALIGYSGSGTIAPQYCYSSSSTTGWSKPSNWDFVNRPGDGENDIWRMCVDNVSRPYLSWEFAQNGDFACGDGVDFADLMALAEHWLLSKTANPATFNYACDADGDEQINLADFVVLGENWQ